MHSPEHKLIRMRPRVTQRIFQIILISLLPAAALARQVPDFAFTIDSSHFAGGIFPSAVSADISGNVYISSLSSVIKLAPNGASLTNWGSLGTGPGHFAYPGPFACDHAISVYAIDAENNRVEKFDQYGHYVLGWGSSGTGPGQFDFPDGIAVDSFDRIYVADGFNNRIQVFSSSGAFLSQFGSAGTNGTQLFNPGVITIDSSNNLYVVDVPPTGYTNFRVQKLGLDGTVLAQWPAYGINTAGGIEVAGIATDPSNNVYVADAENNDIQKFASDGTFLGEWGSTGTGPGEFRSAMGIGIDPTGNYVYVADYYNGRVEVFAYQALAPLIYQSPTNQTIPAGTTLTVSVGAYGAQTLTYDWQFNGQPVSSVTDSALVIPNASLSDSGIYGSTVTNSLGVAIASNAVITVLPVVITTLPASQISATGAILQGSATLGANDSAVWFDWGTDTNYGNISGFNALTPNTTVLLNQRLTNLSGAFVYHYRLTGSNSLGVVHGQDAQFQVGVMPTLLTLPISGVTSTSVVFNATANPGARDTTAYFRWGTSTGYGKSTVLTDIGSGLTAVPVQGMVTGLQAGTIYHGQAVASNALGVITGPDFAFITGPWTVVPTPATTWVALAASADGSTLAAVANNDHVYVSTNSGLSWITNNSSAQYWRDITMSADGNRMVAVSSGSPTVTGPAYFSTNHGVNWNVVTAGSRNWAAVAASGDGTRLIGADSTLGLILLSTNSGLNWITNTMPLSAGWNTVASSADGQHLLVASGGLLNNPSGPLLASTNAGLSWITNNLPNQYWEALAASADGKTFFAAAGGRQHVGSIYISTNLGVTWSVTSAPVTNWQSLACSADGATVTAGLTEGKAVFTSTNSGLTWQTQVVPAAFWASIASSADGARLYAAGDLTLYTLQNVPTPRLQIALTGSQPTLSWIVPSAPFTIQTASGLVSPQWSGLGASPTLNINTLRYQAPVPANTAAAFYRLASP